MSIPHSTFKNTKEYNDWLKATILLEQGLDTIFNIYKQHIFYGVLCEEYSELNLKPENIKASLIIIIDKCQTNHRLSVLNELNTEFLKANITFILDNSSTVKKFSYPNLGIIGGNSAPNMCYISVTSNFLKMLANIDITKDNDLLNEISEAIMTIYSHEKNTFASDKEKSKYNKYECRSSKTKSLPVLVTS